MSSQGWPQMGHLEEGDRDPCTPAHNRCVGIGKTPFPGVENTDSGARNSADTPAPTGGHGAVSSTSWASGPASLQDAGVQRNSGPHHTHRGPWDTQGGLRPRSPPLFLSPSSCPARLAPTVPSLPQMPPQLSSFCPMPDVQPSLTQSLPARPGPQPISFTDAHPWAHHRAQSLAPSFLTLPAPQSFQVSQI